jgi:hypothetical protein
MGAFDGKMVLLRLVALSWDVPQADLACSGLLPAQLYTAKARTKAFSQPNRRQSKCKGVGTRRPLHTSAGKICSDVYHLSGDIAWMRYRA